MNVFIVDDSPRVRAGLAALLTEIKGLSLVGEAADVTEAVRAIADLRPEVVILDFSLPSGNGLEVLAAAKRLVPAPVVIMFTVMSYPSLRDRCLQAGADRFLDKFADLETLLALLRDWAQRDGRLDGLGGENEGRRDG